MQAFEREIEAYRRREPHALIAEYQPDAPEGARYVFRLRVFEPPDPAWGGIAGDFVHNARSALDYLAWQLVLLNGEQPDASVQFPIFTASSDYNRRAPRMVALMDTRHARLLKETQPYHATYPSQHPLAILNTLSNSDKHRVLTVPLTSIRSVGWDVVALGPGVTVDMKGSHGDPWQAPEDNAVIAVVPVTVMPGVEPQVYIERMINVEVTLDGREEAVKSLRDIYETVKSILFETFVNEFRDEIRVP